MTGISNVSPERSLHLLSGDDPAWSAFLDTSHPTLFQSDTWCRTVCSEYGFAFGVLAVLCKGAIVGGIPFARVNDFRGIRHQTFAFSDVCEPLGDAWPELERWIADGLIPWSIRCRALDTALADQTVQTGVHHEVRLDDIGAVRARCHLSHRQFVTKAERSGVTVRRLHGEEGLATFYPLFSSLRKQKFHLLPQGRSFFERIATAYMPDRGCVLAAYAQERPIAAIVLLIEGSTLYYKWAASDPTALQVRPNNLLLDRAMAYACELGLSSFDLGISEGEGLIHFKRQLGMPKETPVFRARYHLPPPSDAVLEVERALGALTRLITAPDVPLSVAEATGAELYRFFV